MNAHAKLQDRMMRVHDAHKVFRNPKPEGLWLTWDEAQEILAFMAGVPAAPVPTHVTPDVPGLAELGRTEGGAP